MLSTALPCAVFLLSLLVSPALFGQEPRNDLAIVEPGGVRALLVAKTESVISSLQSGRIVEFKVNAGEKVEAGQVLVRLDCTMHELQQQIAEAELMAAEATLKSRTKLKAHNAVSDLDYTQAEAADRKARAELGLRREQVDRCTLSAPYSGRVIKRIAKPFGSVQLGEPLLEMVNEKDLFVELYVPSAWSRWIKPGSGFLLKVDETGKEYRAKVTRVGAKIDAVSQTLAAYGMIEDANSELLPGMSGTAIFDAAE